jgi:predicted DNA-binding transcriptional regulator AlpA
MMATYKRKKASRRLLTTEQTASVLGVSPWTLFAWRKRGTGPPYVRFSRQAIRYSMDDLTAWLRTRRVVGEAKQPEKPLVM